MSPEAAKILESALALAPAERQALIASLAVSLDVEGDGEDPSSLAKVWDAEIARRCKDIDEGRATLVPWSEVRSRLRVRRDGSC